MEEEDVILDLDKDFDEVVKQDKKDKIQEASTLTPDDAPEVRELAVRSIEGRYEKASELKSEENRKLMLGNDYERYKAWKTTGELHLKDEDMEPFRQTVKKKKLNRFNADIPEEDMKQWDLAAEEIRTDSKTNVDSLNERLKTKSTELESTIQQVKELEAQIKLDPQNKDLRKQYRELAQLYYTQRDEGMNIWRERAEVIGAFKDADLMAKEIGLSNDWGERASISLENTGDAFGVLGFSILDSVLKATDSYEDIDNPVEDWVRKSLVNFQEDYNKDKIRLQTEFARTSWDEATSWQDYLTIAGEGFFDNMPSVAAIASTMAANAAQYIPGSQPVTVPLAQTMNTTMPYFMGAMASAGKMADYDMEESQAQEVLNSNIDERIANSQGNERAELIRQKTAAQNALSRTESQKWFTVGAYGLAEYWGERMTFKLLDDIMYGSKNMAKLARQNQHQKWAKDYIAKHNILNATSWKKIQGAIKKVPYIGRPLAGATSMARAAGIEAYQEGATQIMQNAADIWFGGDDKSIGEGVEEAAFHGAVLGLLIGGAGSGVKTLIERDFMDGESMKALDSIVDQINKYSIEMFNENLDGDSALVLMNKINGLARKAGIFQDIVRQRILQHSPGELKQIFELSREERSINREIKTIEDSNMSPQMKQEIIQGLETQAEGVRAKRWNILNRNMNWDDVQTIESPEKLGRAKKQRLRKWKERLEDSIKQANLELKKLREIAGDFLPLQMGDLSNNITDRIKQNQGLLNTINSEIERRENAEQQQSESNTGTKSKTSETTSEGTDTQGETESEPDLSNDETPTPSQQRLEALDLEPVEDEEVDTTAEKLSDSDTEDNKPKKKTSKNESKPRTTKKRSGVENEELAEDGLPSGAEMGRSTLEGAVGDGKKDGADRGLSELESKLAELEKQYSEGKLDDEAYEDATWEATQMYNQDRSSSLGLVNEQEVKAESKRQEALFRKMFGTSVPVISSAKQLASFAKKHDYSNHEWNDHINKKFGGDVDAFAESLFEGMKNMASGAVHIGGFGLKAHMLNLNTGAETWNHEAGHVIFHTMPEESRDSFIELWEKDDSMAKNTELMRLRDYSDLKGKKYYDEAFAGLFGFYSVNKQFFNASPLSRMMEAYVNAYESIDPELQGRMKDGLKELESRKDYDTLIMLEKHSPIEADRINARKKVRRDEFVKKGKTPPPNWTQIDKYAGMIDAEARLAMERRMKKEGTETEVDDSKEISELNQALELHAQKMAAKRKVAAERALKNAMRENNQEKADLSRKKLERFEDPNYKLPVISLTQEDNAEVRERLRFLLKGAKNLTPAGMVKDARKYSESNDKFNEEVYKEVFNQVEGDIKSSKSKFMGPLKAKEKGFATSKLADLLANVNDLRTLSQALGKLGNRIYKKDHTKDLKEEKKNQIKQAGVVLNAAQRAGLIKYVRAKKGYNPKLKIMEYEITIQIADRNKLYGFLKAAAVKPKTTPEFQKPLSKPWDSTKKDKYYDFISHISPEQRAMIGNPEYDTVFDVLKNANGVEYTVETDLLDAFSNLRDSKLFKSIKPEKEAAYAVTLGVAHDIRDGSFFGAHFLDFRGRLSIATIGMNHSNSKLAVALERMKPKPLGKDGLKWLKRAAVDAWDKSDHIGDDSLRGIPVGLMTFSERDRYYDLMEDKFMEWAENIEGTVDEWGQADTPFLFMSYIYELYKAKNYDGGMENFPSGVIVHHDATTSGAQFLSLLTKSKAGASKVNLTRDVVRRDLYTEVGDAVMKHVGKPIKEGSGEYNKIRKMQEEMKEWQIKVSQSDPSLRYEIAQQFKAWKYGEGETKPPVPIEEFESRVWAMPAVQKKWRKVMKEPVMTKYYSSEPLPQAESLLNEFMDKEGFEGIDKYTYHWLTRKISVASGELMPGPEKLMKVFQEVVLEASRNNSKDTKGHPAKFNMPYTNFLWSQYYQNPVSEDVSVPNENALTKDWKPSKDKVSYPVVVIGEEGLDASGTKRAASPNVIHAFDALLVHWMQVNTKYDIQTIHDSFGAVPADAEQMYRDIRRGVVELFEGEPLKDVFTQLVGAERANYFLYEWTHKNYKGKGVMEDTLDVSEVLDNEYAFSAGSGRQDSEFREPFAKLIAEKFDDTSLLENLKKERAINKANETLEQSKPC